jgi:hypothetical protein
MFLAQVISFWFFRTGWKPGPPSYGSPGDYPGEGFLRMTDGEQELFGKG